MIRAVKPEVYLNLYFKDAGEKDMTVKFKNAKSNASEAQITNLSQVIIANGTAFLRNPTTENGAELVQVTVTAIDTSGD